MKKGKTIEYPAMFEPAEEGGFNVSFPSFPGCFTFGKNFEEAKKNAEEVLRLWLEELASAGKKIPVLKFRPIIDSVETVLPSKAKIAYASHHG